MAPRLGLFFGKLARRIFERYGVTLEAERWNYGTAARKTFEPHRRLDGKVFQTPDDDVLVNSRSWPPVSHYYPGDHSGCFPAGTLVSGPISRGAFLRWFEGQLVELTFASGKFLSATPNHPILTTKGWVAAGELDELSEVLCCVDAHGVTALVPDDYQVPALIEDVVAACGVSDGMSARSVPVAPEDFHGDGIGSEISVVWTDSLLGDSGNVELQEPLLEPALAGIQKSSSLASDGPSTSLLERFLGPSFGDVRRSGNRLTFGKRSGGIPKGLGFFEAPNGDVSSDEFGGDGTSTDSEFARYLQAGGSSLVETDRIVQKRLREFRGHVYNLQTGTHWYCANNVIVHNCACGSTPTLVSTITLGPLMIDLEEDK